MAYEDLEAQFGMGARVAGVDEAGRGPLAGDVVAAAVILMPDHRLVGLNDSKQLSELKRERLFEQIKAQSLAFCIARATVEEIERYNILQATMMAMTRALNGLKKKPQGVLIDGNRVPKGLKMPSVAIVKGDSRVHAISAASILAKVTRDREMVEAHKQYPEYGFDQHKGYPTAQHVAALTQYGPCAIHRKTYKPVRACIDAEPKQMTYL